MNPKLKYPLLFLFGFLAMFLVAREVEKPKPLYPLQSAEQPASLRLFDDGHRTLGWITGKDRSGQKVRLRANGKTHRLTVADDNTFIWPHDPFTDGQGMTNEITAKIGGLRASVRPLTIATNERTCVYFVVDRNLYRPNQELQFAGFVRRLGPDNTFEPVAATNVTVELRTVTKGNLATTIKVQTDPVGRFVGGYTFTGADALDDYRLSAKGMVGDARFRLGEFRKPKVKLAIETERVDNNLLVRFATLDFKENPVSAGNCSFNIQVQHGKAADTASDTTGSKAKLDPAKFAFPMVAHNNYYHELSPTDRALLKRGIQPSGQQIHNQVVHQENGNIELGPAGTNTHVITMPASWREQADLKVVVSAVAMDGNGREQRGSKTITINPSETEENDDSTRLSMDRLRFAPGETIPVELPLAEGQSGVLVVTKLAAGATNADQPYMHVRASYGWPQKIPGQLIKELHTAMPLDASGTTSFVLPDAGVYKLEAVVRGPDGERKLARTIDVDDTMIMLDLRMDQLVWNGGEAISGILHSPNEGASVLLTLEDGSGIRHHETLRVANGRASFEIRPPAKLGYGCVLSVRSVDNEGHAHLASRRVHVLQTERSLEIETQAPKTVGPGETVELEFLVKRGGKKAAGEVDLVVSVYDHSLHAVATDYSKDPRHFFLADERAFDDSNNRHLRQLLGDVTIEEAIDAVELPSQIRDNWTSHVNNNMVYGYMATLLLRGQGLTIVATTQMYGSWGRKYSPEQKLADVLLERRGAQAGLKFSFVDDTFFQHPFGMDPRQANFWGGYYGAGFNGWYGRQNYWHRGWNQWDMGGSPFLLSGNSLFSTRADGRASANAWQTGAVGMNGAISGQALMSYMPAAGLAPMPSPTGLAGGSELSGAQSIRRDFSDSAFFDGRVRTDKNGKATVSFKMPDSLTNWRVSVVAVSPDLSVGRSAAGFQTYKPIMVWPMPARAFTVGDEVDIFAVALNQTEEDQLMEVKCDVNNGKLLTPAATSVLVKAGESTKVYWRYQPARPGFTEILMSTACAAGSDASLKAIPVSDNRVVESLTVSGTTERKIAFDIPEEVDLETAVLELKFAPSLLADLDDTLDYLVQYPHGCVEQTMSRFLPTLRVAELLEHQGIERPALSKNIPKYAEAGVKRLIQLQKPDGGWGWIGNSQTHELMTPYALLGLIEAKQLGYDFDQAKAIETGISRLRNYCYNASTMDRVYCMHTFQLEKPLEDRMWKFLEEQVGSFSDYATALTLDMAIRGDREQLAKKAAKQLRDKAVRENGTAHWTTAGFNRWGNDPNEITAAALKALVAYEDLDDPLFGEVLAWLHKRKRGNRWNSTKDTAMIVYALCDYLAIDGKQNAKNTAKIHYNVNDQRHELSFTNAFMHTVTLPGRSLVHGDNEFAFGNAPRGSLFRASLLHLRAGGHIEAKSNGIQVSRNFFMIDPESKKKTEIKQGAEIPLGHYLEMRVHAVSQGNLLRYCLVAAPKPCGHETLPETDTRFGSSNHSGYVLREDRTATLFWHHEHHGGNYHNTVFLHPELTGTFTVPPAYSELMYETEVRGHSDSFTFSVVKPEGEE